MAMSPSAWTYAISFNPTRTTSVVTVTVTAPEPAGVTTAILVSLSTMNEVADTLPKRTAVAPVKAAPVIATDVPPAAGPTLGLTEAAESAGDLHMQPRLLRPLAVEQSRCGQS
jgi:hypothetical protein